MNKKRRTLLRSCLALTAVLPSLSFAQSQAAKPESVSPVYVVKYVSFSCNFCRAAEQGDTLVEQAVRGSGGEVSVAPVDTMENPSYIRERLYYASRKHGAEIAQRVRAAMFSATQDHGLTFTSMESLNTWLAVNAADWMDDTLRKALIQEAGLDETTGAIGRALRLARSAGVDVLPSYVIVQDGDVKAVFDRQGYPSLHDLRDKLARRISEMVPIRTTQPVKERP